MREEREKRTLQDARGEKGREKSFISSAVQLLYAVMCASVEQLAMLHLVFEGRGMLWKKQRTSKMQLEKKKGEDLYCLGGYVCQHGTACRSNMVLRESKVPLAMSGMDLTASSVD